MSQIFHNRKQTKQKMVLRICYSKLFCQYSHYIYFFSSIFNFDKYILYFKKLDYSFLFFFLCLLRQVRVKLILLLRTLQLPPFLYSFAPHLHFLFPFFPCFSIAKTLLSTSTNFLFFRQCHQVKCKLPS